MAEFTFFYRDRTQRQNIIRRENNLGRRLLNDDFIDADGNATNGRSGRLTFTDDAEPGLSPEATQLHFLTKKVINPATPLTLDEINQLLRLEHGGPV